MATLPAAAADFPSLLVTLDERGWAAYAAEHSDAEAVIGELGRIGDLLGTRTAGRAGALEELIQPQQPGEAHARSLSARYGLNALPFHTELSHRPLPCRYLLLGCVDPGSPSAVTMLLDWRTLGLSPDELQLLEAAPILVRNGRRSFYTMILPSDHAFLRYDPGCLEAVDARGRAALRLIEHRLASGAPRSHKWRRGDILIIDNWRVLHGRGPSNEGSGRRLARILIDV
jgi:Taurine catabolism dioxygenase TauD, TfdA family